MLVVKNPPPSAGDIRDLGSIPGPGRSPGGGHGNPLQCSCLENPMDRGAWRVMVHGVTKSWTRLKRLSTHAGESFGFWETVCDKGKGKHHRLKLAEFFFFFFRERQKDWSGPKSALVHIDMLAFSFMLLIFLDINFDWFLSLYIKNNGLSPLRASSDAQLWNLNLFVNEDDEYVWEPGNKGECWFCIFGSQ